MKKSSYVAPEIPTDEIQRIQVLKAMNILDTPPEFSLDEIATLASRICNTPISLISLIDENRQWFKSKVGISVSETPREHSFCGHAVFNSKTLIVEDSHLDSRFKGNPLVTGDPRVRFYAGAPLITSNGQALGTLCVIDHVPRTLSLDQIDALEILSRQVVRNFERNKIELELMIQKNFLNSIVNVLPQLVSYVDTSYHYLFRNLAYQKWFNLSAEDLKNTSMREFIGEKAFLHVKPYMDNALAGLNQNYELNLLLEMNARTLEKKISANYTPDFGKDGRVRGFFAVVTDLTEQRAKQYAAEEQGKMLEIALHDSRTSEKIFRAYFQNSVVGMINLDSKLKFIDANPAYLKMMEYSIDELRSMSENDVTHPEDRKISDDTIKRSIGERTAILRFEKRNVTKSGKVVCFQISGQAIELEGVDDYRLFVIVQDVTSLKEAEKLLQEQQLKLIQNTKMSALGEMAGGVAHEINNPLSIILGKLDTLEILYKEERHNEVAFFRELEKVRLTSIRIGKIVSGLRAFSRDGSKDPIVTIDVNSIISDVISLCSEKFASQGIKIIYDSELNTEIECRPTDISQILLNLLNNAFDAIQNQNSKWIKIEVSTEASEMVCIAVIDSGTGVPVSFRDKIMQPFFTTKEVGKGTGLGLSISKGLAEAHNGDLELDAKSIQTKFQIKLPIRQGNTPS